MYVDWFCHTQWSYAAFNRKCCMYFGKGLVFIFMQIAFSMNACAIFCARFYDNNGQCVRSTFFWLQPTGKENLKSWQPSNWWMLVDSFECVYIYICAWMQVYTHRQYIYIHTPVFLVVSKTICINVGKTLKKTVGGMTTFHVVGPFLRATMLCQDSTISSGQRTLGSCAQNARPNGYKRWTRDLASQVGYQCAHLGMVHYTTYLWWFGDGLLLFYPH